MTKTETAFRAIMTALATAAQSPPLVAPMRNEDLISRLVDVGSGLACYLNVLDGDRPDGDEMLGADLAQIQSYEITRHVSIEWAVAGGTSDARETRFDDGMKAIWDAIKPNMTSGSPVYLGGAVDSVLLIDILPHGKTTVARAGIPNVKSCEFVFALSFTSSDPF